MPQGSVENAINGLESKDGPDAGSLRTVDFMGPGFVLLYCHRRLFALG